MATDGHDWVRRPASAKGTWLAVPPTWFSDGTFEALASPRVALAFAGSDIAAEGAGWIEGAVGERRRRRGARPHHALSLDRQRGRARRPRRGA